MEGSVGAGNKFDGEAELPITIVFQLSVLEAGCNLFEITFSGCLGVVFDKNMYPDRPPKSGDNRLHKKQRYGQDHEKRVE